MINFKDFKRFYIREKLEIGGLVVFSRPVEFEEDQINWLLKHCNHYEHDKVGRFIMIRISERYSDYIVTINYEGH